MRVRVKPNTKSFSLKKENNEWVARVPAKPIKGAANKELLKRLSKKFNGKATLVKGVKSRIKEIIIN